MVFRESNAQKRIKYRLMSQNLAPSNIRIVKCENILFKKKMGAKILQKRKRKIYQNSYNSRLIFQWVLL